MASLANLSDLEILTLTLIGESRGEPIEGQVAVASVVRNRVNTYHKSYSEICLAPKQFSCWNEDDPNRVLLEELADGLLSGSKLSVPSHMQCRCVARGVISNEILDNTNGSLNYLSTDLFLSANKPHWAVNPKSAKTIGNQTFIKV